jgi:SAM-dependent methyltransferase
MPGGSLDRLRDQLPINDPYDGVVADAYDTWVPVDEAWPDDAIYRDLLREVDGSILELGCGTGRPLIQWLADGLPVEGIDASADMLAILRRHARERGLDPVLHHGDFAPLSLDTQYAAIVCVAGSFMLIDDRRRAEESLASYREHLNPGGIVALSMGMARGDPRSSLVWRLRRTGTSAEGITYVVHEAVYTDPTSPVEEIYNQIERYGADGKLIDTIMRRHRLRTWERAEFEAALVSAGFVDVGSLGDESAWVTVGRRP